MKAIITFLTSLFLWQFSQAQVYDDYIGTGHFEGISVSSSDPVSNAIKSINGEGFELETQAASRFLASATLGATIDEIKTVTEIGMESWIDDQMTIPPTNYTIPTIEIIYELYDRCMDNLGKGPCSEVFNLAPYMWRYAFWHNTMREEDKLRQRVAMALSEVLVVSDRSQLENLPHALAYYYDILMTNALGNYKDLLTDVSLSPAMGFYLSHMNNPKSNPALNIQPDENYAREIMQLFSIGLYELNQNGTRKLDNNGEWISTYNNDDIKGLAKVFTGLSGSAWAEEDNPLPLGFGYPFFLYSFIDQMAMYDNWHEQGEKNIVGNYTIPAGQTGMEDVEEAIDHLFNHDNVGPFLSSHLIQRLVKSNPSPEYVERISNVFSNNGNGVRGDLAAVVKAILLDEEALECYWIEDAKNGMLKSPMLRYTQLMLALQAETETEWFWNSAYTFNEQTEHHVLSSPTVFNAYSPDYVPDAAFDALNMVGPEFQILNSSTSSNYINYMMLALMNDYFKDNLDFEFPDILNESFAIPYTPDTAPYKAELSDEQWLALYGNPEEMLDYLDILLTNGQLHDDRKEKLSNSMKRADVFNDTEAAYYGLFMMMIDPDFLIMK